MRWHRSQTLVWVVVSLVGVGLGAPACGDETAPGIDPTLPEPVGSKGALRYASAFDGPESVEGWVMEGPGQLRFEAGGMEMFAPDDAGHHVFWSPVEFPESFVAEWTLQNLNLNEGLCIVFFGATGREGEDLFDPALPERDGTYAQYTNGAIDTYHVSYYADGRPNPEREISHLRKSHGFHLVQQGEPGVPLGSTREHQVRLVKLDEHLAMYVDDRLIINWVDDGRHGAPLGAGRIGLRQMRWTRFRYRDFAVWDVLEP